MPKYNVTISFSLRTEIEPEGIHFDRDYPDAVEDISDDSYWSRTDIDCDGGSVAFTVEAESEEDAERISEEVIYDGQEWTDDSGFAWMVDSVSVEVEKVEIPMDLDRATDLVEAYLAQMEGMDDDLKEAFGFLLDLVADQSRRVIELVSDKAELRSEVTRLGTLLTELQVAQAVPAVSDPETGIITEG